MDDELKRVLEPRVPSAASRLHLLQALVDAGVPTSLLIAPVIPAVNDRELERILERAADCGVRHASWILLRLPHELKSIFGDWLEAHLPQRAAHVTSLLRQASGGRDYDARYGRRQTGSGPYAEMIARRFAVACARLGIASGRRPQSLDCSLFRPPGPQQLSLV